MAEVTIEHVKIQLYKKAFRLYEDLFCQKLFLMSVYFFTALTRLYYLTFHLHSVSTRVPVHLNVWCDRTCHS